MEKGNIKIPIAVSNRHIHLTSADLELLFGDGFKLNKKRDLPQKGQFAAEECVSVAGPKGKLEPVRIVGPERNYTQLEVSKTDSAVLGIDPPLSYGGKASDPAEVTIVGPKRGIKRKCAVVAMRHIHCSESDAKNFGFKDGDIVSVKAEGGRSVTFHNVVVRVDKNFVTEMHIDTDEAMAAGILKNIPVYGILLG